MKIWLSMVGNRLYERSRLVSKSIVNLIILRTCFNLWFKMPRWVKRLVMKNFHRNNTAHAVQVTGYHFRFRQLLKIFSAKSVHIRGFFWRLQSRLIYVLIGPIVRETLSQLRLLSAFGGFKHTFAFLFYPCCHRLWRPRIIRHWPIIYILIENIVLTGSSSTHMPTLHMFGWAFWI